MRIVPVSLCLALALLHSFAADAPAPSVQLGLNLGSNDASVVTISVKNNSDTPMTLTSRSSDPWRASIWFEWRVNGRPASYSPVSAYCLTDHVSRRQLEPRSATPWGEVRLSDFYFIQENDGIRKAIPCFREAGRYTIQIHPSKEWPGAKPVLGEMTLDTAKKGTLTKH